MTKLLYLEDFNVTDCEALVEKVEKFEDKDVVVLDQTCFYPKGGGQDFDTGKIKGGHSTFEVEAVFFVDGEVKHSGSFVGDAFVKGDKVSCQVDEHRRELNTRLHSAGHVIDMAVRALKLEWHPTKGAHYPHMSFVMYDGEMPEDKDTLKKTLKEKVNTLIKAGSTNKIEFLTPEEMTKRGAVVPPNLPKNKPSRAMIYDDFVVPCGGTHVQDIAEVGPIAITQIKRKDGAIRVSYSLS